MLVLAYNLLMRSVIGSMYRRILKPILFLFDPESVHTAFIKMGELLGSFPLSQSLINSTFTFRHPSLLQKINGITFENPVGLSAGFDKDAHTVNILPDVGFGFAQIGSITALPYEGNPKPRLYRLPLSQGIVVYFGLKNIGVKKIIEKFKQNYVSPRIPISISVAKTNCDATANESAGMEDYIETLTQLRNQNVGDIYTINISCPNTFGGEPFTTPEKLERLLLKVDELKITKPIWIKMPISISADEFDSLTKVATRHNVQGLVIGNLQKDQTDKSIIEPIPSTMKGGVSGKPTWELSNQHISRTYKKYGNTFIIIGVGGIFSAEDAYEKIKRGATLVQLITGMIFMGPQLIGEINEGLYKLLQKEGYSNISQAVGAHHKTNS
ncbi:dihydroorotate dehydrogenase (quinone) [candidate division WWE3 bacterium CG22_combo_CG10-13_8_21_14_all_39_12]|uniref:Dihydroorotate dehydrogenase (quinone) n=2 Tax=Katanobacteria TaxID=422282 RepID=A0A2M7X182_UNCKA|nr:MAG: dihydroorotate dehydrogenase (quinone) [candidate division WWE3 bacterium CG22_combo_CG10-13_8_21_14_all_39_12]PJA39888.1 MAG: quinone-dependent dihydroorotate dehydrogenase [candidate division WWE3 bacterium CG_4_9_14_3_um_filter_39_7]